MKIQLSPIKIIKDALVVWQEPGPEVDIVMDLRKITFAEGSLDAIYAFHVLDHIFPNEVLPALTNWYSCLKPNNKGALFVVVNDFEKITRGFVSGDFSIVDVNQKFCQPTHFTQDNLVDNLIKAGFKEPAMRVWFNEVPNLFTAQPFELIISTEK